MPATALPEPRRDEAPAAPPCPQCNGPVVPLRECCRCLRCGFSMCLDCEGERDAHDAA
jgi:hypothetical protein